MELILRGDDAMLQRAGVVVVTHLAATMGVLTQAAVDAVGKAKLGHGWLICATRTKRC